MQLSLSIYFGTDFITEPDEKDAYGSRLLAAGMRVSSRQGCIDSVF